MEEHKAAEDMSVGELQDLVAELEERVEYLETTVGDWAPFVNQMRTTIAQLAGNPMIMAMVPPQFRATLTQYSAPKE